MQIEWKELELEDILHYEGLFEVLNHLSPSVALSEDTSIRLLKRMQKSGTHCLIAFVEKKIAGTISLMIEQKLLRGGALAGHIEDVIVHPDFEGMGVASLLLKEAIKMADRENCYKIILDCDRRLIPLYQSVGFEESGVCMKMYLNKNNA